MKRFYEEIGVMRGILTVLIVVVHACVQYVEAGVAPSWMPPFGQVITGFIIPAFAFIAGFCGGRIETMSSRGERLAYCRDRMSRLLVPYLSWALAYTVLRLCAGGLAKSQYDYHQAWRLLIGYNPDGAMWFLWSLAVSTALLVVLRAFLSLRLVLTVSFVLFAASTVFFKELIIVSPSVNIPFFLFFMSLGLWTAGRYDRLRGFLLKWTWAVAVLFAVFSYALVIMRYGYSLCFVLTSVTGTWCVWALATGVCSTSRLGTLRTALAILGAYAMEVYILAEPVKLVCRTVLFRMSLPLPLSLGMMIGLMLVVPVLSVKFVFARFTSLEFLLFGKPSGGKGKK